MSDEALIRRTNLRKLGKSANELARLGIGGYSYWAAMLAENSVKPFGEKVARKLEESLGLVRGYLDGDGGLLGPEPTGYPKEVLIQPTERFSAAAVAIAKMFDTIPVEDKEVRARAFKAATNAIIQTLQEAMTSSRPGRDL